MAQEFKLSYTGAEINSKLGRIEDLAAAVSAHEEELKKKVGVTAQTLTEEQKAQARANIGAVAGAEALPSVSASNNGQFLRVVNGVWAAATIANAEEATF